jgi:hypothetical protein
MRLSRIIFVVVVAAAAIRFTQAQQEHLIVLHGLAALRQSASSKTEFTLDHSMLVFAAKMDPDNEDLRRVIAGVSGVSVHNLRFAGRWAYDPEELTVVKEEYRSGGWKQVMNKSDKDGNGSTDVWIRLDNNAISNVAVLLAKADEVDLIVVSGSISPMDLSHLGGHFGIPKIEGGVTIPNTDSHP